jgi:hypothetical protein
MVKRSSQSQQEIGWDNLLIGFIAIIENGTGNTHEEQQIIYRYTMGSQDNQLITNVYIGNVEL